MVGISIQGDRAVFTVLGLHKFWALKDRVTVRLAHVRAVRRADPSVLAGWWKGWRMPGTHIPWFLIAGDFYRGGERRFWDVRRADRAIVVELADESYAELIVEVADPDAAIALLTVATRAGS